MAEKRETIETFCIQDQMACRVAVEVKEGKIEKIQPPRGVPCIKCNRLQETIYHPNRLKHPLQRVGRKGEGKWERISWEKALDTMALKFGEIKENYGGEKICSVIGSGHKYTPYGTGVLFSRIVNSPNTLDANQLCTMPVSISTKLTIGNMGWVPFHDNSPDYPNSKCVVFWGTNHTETRPPHAVATRLASFRRKMP